MAELQLPNDAESPLLNCSQNVQVRE